MGILASPMRYHGYRRARTMRRLARADAGQAHCKSPAAVRRRSRADNLAGKREPTPPRRGVVGAPDDA